ncbi:MAG: ComF family protein [Endomicrobia bacterium]|nr:ComF family protein [Endomicrobiia bacterium]
MIKNIIEAFIYTLFPKICFYCKTPLNYYSNNPLCEKCIKQIKFIHGAICKKCGVPLESGGEYCFNCKNLKNKFYFESIYAIVEYKEPIRTLIHEFKYSKKIFLKNFLSNIIKNWWEKNKNILPKIDIISAIPLHPLKNFLRGFNQSDILAKELSKHCKLIYHPSLLKRTKFTISQSKLSKEKRLLNVKDAFEVLYLTDVKDKNILLIDDVSTTCETINQSAKALKKSGAKNVFGLVLSRDT